VPGNLFERFMEPGRRTILNNQGRKGIEEKHDGKGRGAWSGRLSWRKLARKGGVLLGGKESLSKGEPVNGESAIYLDNRASF